MLAVQVGEECEYPWLMTPIKVNQSQGVGKPKVQSMNAADMQFSSNWAD